MGWHGLADEVVSRYGLVERYRFSWDANQQGWNDSRKFRTAFLQMPDFGLEQKVALAQHGLDNRNPLLNRRLVEFFLSIPDEQYFYRGIPRNLSRRILADRLPSTTCNRQERGAQGGDFYLHLRQNLPWLRQEISAWQEYTELTDLIDIQRFQLYLDQLAMSDDNTLAHQSGHINNGFLRNVATIRFIRRSLLQLSEKTKSSHL
jgi:asparagine synthase (glutamine-hydrolysing)